MVHAISFYSSKHFILFVSTLYAVIVEIWYPHISPSLAKSILPASSIFTHCYFKFVHIFKFPLHIEGEQTFFSTKLFFLLKNSAAYMQLWMHTSTVLWALQTFSSWNIGKWAVTSLLNSPQGRESAQDVKRVLFPAAPGKLFGSSDHRLRNVSRMPRNGICPNLSPALSQDGSNWLHEVTYMHRSSGLPCPTWWGLLSQTGSCTLFTWKIFSPRLLTAKENSVLPTCSCSTPLWLSHCISPLMLFPLTLLDHQTSEYTGRVPPARSGVWSALPLLPEWKIKVCSQIETS